MSNELSSLEHDIEATRDRLASNIDQLLHRASPKTIVSREVTTIRSHFVDADGAPRTDNILKVAGGVAGVIALFAIVRMIVR